VFNLFRDCLLCAHAWEYDFNSIDLLVHLVPLCGQLLYQWRCTQSALRWIYVLEYKFQNDTDSRCHFFDINLLHCYLVCDDNLQRRVENLLGGFRRSALSKVVGMKFADIFVGEIAAPTSSVHTTIARFADQISPSKNRCYKYIAYVSMFSWIMTWLLGKIRVEFGMPRVPQAD
jgi:hypothetical protein